jgi:regulatory protein
VEISKVEKVKFKKAMFKISFKNSRKSLIISADSVVKFFLKSGVDIPKAVYKEILFCDRLKSGISEALSLLSKRSYSVKSLQKRLVQRGYEIKSATEIIERLKELNYLNDKEYAKNCVAYLSKKGKGEFLIRVELERQGIEKDLINSVLEIIKTNEETSEQIVKMLKTKFKNFDGKNKNEVRKATSFFLRRGFSCEDIAKAFRICSQCCDYVDTLNN